MKARDFVIVLVVMAVLVIPATSVLNSADADAPTNESFDAKQYYRGQLTQNQQAIYDALESLSTGDATWSNYYGSASKEFGIKVTVGSYHIAATDSKALTALALADMERAWQATALDDPLAWWTWSTDNACTAMFYTEARYANNQVFKLDGTEVTGLTFYVWINGIYDKYGSDSYPSLTQKVDAVKAKITSLTTDGTISGDSNLDKLKSINKYLCSSAFVYDKDSTVYSNSIYGALVYGGDTHKILCTAFSQTFKALCDAYSIPCVNVLGLAAQDTNGGHMWNVVSVDCKIGGTQNTYTLGVDVTFDKTGSSTTAYFLSGALTKVSSVTFTQTHQAFTAVSSEDYFLNYFFTAPFLNNDGYSEPSSGTDISALLTQSAPWILVGAICVILAYVLITIGKRGD